MLSETLPSPAPANLLAETLGGLKRLGVTDRGVYDGVLRNTLEGDDRYLGVWSVWEPDALDGRDREHRNRPGHDQTGRYVPLWTRSAGPISVEPNSAYDTGEWYLRPTREGRQTVVDCYEYPMAGARRFITTQVAPIVIGGRCLGAAGVDFAVGHIPSAGAGGGTGTGDRNGIESLLDRGYVFLEDDGRIAYCSTRSQALLRRFIGPAPEAKLPARLRRLLDRVPPPRGAGEGFLFRGGEAELLVRPFRHEDAGRGLLLLHRRARSLDLGALSAREREVWGWMAEGKTNAEIATILALSVHTVKRHVEKVLRKLGVPNRSAAVALGIGPTTYPPGRAARLPL